MTRHSYLLAGALAAAAAALGFACGSSAKPAARRGSSLPPAGSPKDDGTGLLARWSVASPEGGGDLPVGALQSGGAGYGGASYGMYGGMLYGGSTGGNRYGGSLYAGYRFDTSFNPAAAARPAVPMHEGYAIESVTNGGAIEGRVTWPRPPRAPEQLPAAAAAGCRDAIPNETLRIGDDSGVAGAVVYLADIRRGRSSAPIGGVLERRDCRFRPHLQISAPIGTPLRITNSENVDHTVRAIGTEERAAELFSVEIGARGQTDDRAVDRAGTFRVTSAAAGDLASAYVVVPRHPYYVITDDDGRFRLDNVPPGTYQLAVWHEPVVTGIDGEGTPKLTRAFEAAKTVKVGARKTSKVVVKLPAGR